LRCLIHQFQSNAYAFFLVRFLAPDEANIDPVLDLPVYKARDDWDIVGLYQFVSKPLFMVDISQPAGGCQEVTESFLYCSWNVEYQ
jgi:hypothetical protein